MRRIKTSVCDNSSAVSEASFHPVISTRKEGGKGVLPEKFGGGVRSQFLKPFSYLWLKTVFFTTLFMTWPNVWYPIYDHCWLVAGTFALNVIYEGLLSPDGRIDNVEKVASSKKHIQVKVIVQKLFPI